LTEEERGRCQDCGKVWSNEQLRPIRDIFQRVDPGEPMPSGECPERDAFCQLLTSDAN
jgi:hypothetical protein